MPCYQHAVGARSRIALEVSCKFIACIFEGQHECGYLKTLAKPIDPQCDGMWSL